MARSSRNRLFRILGRKPLPTAEIDCLNCGMAVNGAFCSACGQSVTVSRYSINGIGREVYDQFRKFDALKLTRTFVHLLWRPGPFVREYLDGMRVDFQGPIKFFFYGFVLQVFAALLVHYVFGKDLSALTSGTDLRSQLVNFVGTVFWGVCWWAVYRRSELNFAENIVAAMYFTGQSFIYAIVIHVIIGAVVDNEATEGSTFAAVYSAVYLVYSIHFTRGLFREPLFKQILKQLLAIIIYFVILMVLIFGILVINTQSFVQPSNTNSTTTK